MGRHISLDPFRWDYPPQNTNPHIARYLLARGFIYPEEVVLDVACGSGYGMQLLHQVARKIIGYEIDSVGFEEAGKKLFSNMEVSKRDLNTCELPDVDVAVTIETIEHLTPEGMIHFVKQLRKHVKRCIIVTVPLGGTSHEYVNEVPGPDTEKNDFMNDDAVRELIAPEGSGWRQFVSFKFGYSHFGVYFRHE